jgi:hypothetical protein
MITLGIGLIIAGFIHDILLIKHNKVNMLTILASITIDAVGILLLVIGLINLFTH